MRLVYCDLILGVIVMVKFWCVVSIVFNGVGWDYKVLVRGLFCGLEMWLKDYI